MIAIIAGMDKNRVIGKDNRLPWDIPEDLQNFRRLTSGTTIIMGRKTYESIGRPLPNRNNIVITRSDINLEGADVCHSVEEALDKAEEYGVDIFIIGGSNIYEQFIPLADKMFLSHIDLEAEGDSYFPEFNKEEWNIESEEQFEQFKLVIYTRK